MNKILKEQKKIFIKKVKEKKSAIFCAHLTGL